MDFLKLLDDYNKDPGGTIAKFLSELPPDALKPVAKTLAEYMPAPEISVDEVAQATAKILLPAIDEAISKRISTISLDHIKGEIGGNFAQSFDNITNDLHNLGKALKSIQDEMPANVQKLVATAFNQELDKARREAAAARESGMGTQTNPNEPTGEKPHQPATPWEIASAMFDKALANFTVIADGISKLRPPQNNAALLLDVYSKAFATGNKVRQGEATGADAAKEMLELISPKKS